MNSTRILSFVVGLCASLAAGSTYAFAVFAPYLRIQRSYSLTEMNAAINVGDLGLYLGFVAGFAYDRLGARFALLAGGLAQSLGYLLMGLSVIRFSVPWPATAAFLFLVGQGAISTFTGAYGPSLHNFDKKYHGLVMSSNVAAFAAGSIVFSFVYKYRFVLPPPATGPEMLHNMETYMFVLSGVCGGVSIIASFFVHKVEMHRQKVATFTEDMDPLLKPSSSEPAGLTPLQMFARFEWWLLWGASFFIGASGLLWINSQGQIATSLFAQGQSLAASTVTNNLVLTVGLCNVAGRLLGGFASNALYNQSGVQRSWFLVLAAALIMIAHLVWAFFQFDFLYPSAILTGLGYGTLFSIGTSLVATLFGLRYAGTNVGLWTVAPAVGGLVYGSISGVLYGSHAVDDQCPSVALLNSTNITSAEREICFQSSFIFSGSLVFIALVLGVILSIKTRKNASVASISGQSFMKSPLMNQ